MTKPDILVQNRDAAREIVFFPTDRLYMSPLRFLGHAAGLPEPEMVKAVDDIPKSDFGEDK